MRRKGSGRGSVGMRCMSFVNRVPAPPIEGVVERKSGFELREIVRVHARQSKRCRQQARCLRRKVQTSVSAARTIVARRSSGSVVKPNSSIMRSKVHFSPRWLQNTPSRSNGDGAVSLGHARNLRDRDEEEYRAWVDEAANQPWASNAIDFRPGAGDPDGTPLTVQRRHFARRQQRQPGLCPALKAVFEYIGSDAGVTQPRRGSLTEGCPITADHDGGSTGEFAGPFRNIGMCSSDRSRDKPGIGTEIVVRTNVDQCGTSRCPDQAN